MATNHLTINIGTDRQGTYEALTALAQKLGCRITDLAWLGIEGVLQNPPAAAPQGSAPRVGSASGFWVVHEVSDKGRLVAIKVVEVAKRADAAGRVFFRYKTDDAKSRARGLSQAVKAAAYDASVTGIKLVDNKVPFAPLPGAPEAKN